MDDAVQVDIQPPEMLELLDIPVLGLRLGGQLAAPLGHLGGLRREFLHIGGHVVHLHGGGGHAAGQIALHPGDGRFQGAQGDAIGVLLLDGHEIGGVGKEGHGVVRLEHAAFTAGIDYLVQAGHLSDHADEPHF